MKQTEKNRTETVNMLAAAGKIITAGFSIEVGMQNSGLAAALAKTHFQAETALPAVIFSVWHNLTGSLLASIWSRQTAEKTNKETDKQKTRTQFESSQILPEVGT